ncbi:MAG TPA: molybdopterin dinucleotide binding domain-containing protein, partial [Methanomicrobiales archaeon]|nr:molybdopterin dinucleotide binding domain-containing protein [Methanomicrobiales archaeon]
PDKEYPLILTTGRCIWQWHTGTMTRRSVDLEREVPTGWVEINPEDAAALGVADGEMVKAKTRRGEIEIATRVVPTIRKGEVFIPFHYVECAANILTNNALDPVAKIPEFKACAIRIEKLGGA